MPEGPTEREARRARDRLVRDVRRGVERAGAGWLPRTADRIGRRFPRIGRVLVAPALDLARRAGPDDIGTHAGALTYAALLSVPALLLFAASVGAWVLADRPDLQRAVVNGLTGLLPDQVAAAAGDVLTKQVAQAITGRLSLGLIGLAGLLWSASGLASRLRRALGQIFGTARPGLFSGRFAGMVIGVLMIAAILGLALLSGLASWLDGFAGGTAGRVATDVGVVVGEFAFFLAVYRTLTPGHGPAFTGHVPGTVVFVVGWEALKGLGGLLFARTLSRSTALYGTLGALFAAIAFLYATAWLLLAGAEYSAHRWRERSGAPPPPAVGRGDARSPQADAG
jgi:membrane protein